jgi:hypothetical protein
VETAQALLAPWASLPSLFFVAAAQDTLAFVQVKDPQYF